MSISRISWSSATGLGPSPGTFLLGVYDSFSDLHGFIDVTGTTFKLTDINRPSSDFLVDVAAGQTPANSTSLGGSSVGGGGTPSPSLPGVAVLAITGNPNNPTPQTVVVSYPGITANSVILLSYGTVNGYTGGLAPLYRLYATINPVAQTFTIHGQAGFNVFYLAM